MNILKSYRVTKLWLTAAYIWLTDMANDRCPDCNGLYALIGYRHRCVGVAPDPVPAAIVKPATSATAGRSYRYRDADKRRTYQREFMKRWRKKKAAA